MESSGLCCVCVDISSLLLGFISFDSLPTVAINPIAHGHFNIDISDNIFQLSCFFIVGPISLASSSFFPPFATTSLVVVAVVVDDILHLFVNSADRRQSYLFRIQVVHGKKKWGEENKYRDFSNVIFFIDARLDTVNIFRIQCIQCVGGCKPIVSVLACIESWQATRAGWRRIRGKSFSLRRRQRLDDGRLGASTESSMIKALEVIFLSTWNRVWRIIKGGKKSSVFV